MNRNITYHTPSETTIFSGVMRGGSLNIRESKVTHNTSIKVCLVQKLKPVIVHDRDEKKVYLPAFAFCLT